MDCEKGYVYELRRFWRDSWMAPLRQYRIMRQEQIPRKTEF